MTRKAKIIYIIGSVIIGVVSLLAVLLSLVASGAIDARQTKLVYASFSNEFVYDGQAHGEEGWELISGEPVAGRFRLPHKKPMLIEIR